MGKRLFYQGWAQRACGQSLSKGDYFSSLAGAAVTVLSHFLDMGNVKSISAWAWEIPLWGLSTAMAFRLLLAPYEMWKEQKDRADIAEAKLGTRRDPKHDELEVWARTHMDPIFELETAAFLDCNERSASLTDHDRHSQAVGWKRALRSPANVIGREASLNEAQFVLSEYLNLHYLECAKRMHDQFPAVWTLPSYKTWRDANDKFMAKARELALSPGFPLLRESIERGWGEREINEFWPKEPIP